MPVVKIDPGKLSEFIRSQHRETLAGIVETVQETVLLEGPRIVQEELAATTPVPVDRGTYRRGWRADRLQDGAVLYNPVLYAPIIEHGRRPGKMPPLDVLAAWVRRKGIARKPAEIRRAAYAIARRIARRGLEAKRVLGRAERRLTPAVERAVVRFLERGT